MLATQYGKRNGNGGKRKPRQQQQQQQQQQQSSQRTSSQRPDGQRKWRSQSKSDDKNKGK